MKVELKNLTPGTVAVTLNGQLAIVTGYKPTNVKYPILYKLKLGTRGYKGNENDFRAILGVVDLSAFEALNGAGFRAPAPTGAPAWCPDVPAQLKGVKVGDMITIRTRRGTEQAEYLGYKPNRPKNCVSLRMNDREYKGPLSIVVGPVVASQQKPKAKRDDGDVIKDIRNVYCALSPENLTCDGELPRAQVNAKRARLLGELAELFEEIGREVSEEEAYGIF
jgi:hypothetical protein